ncbi:MAG TPA: hypothetical protein PLP19_19445 [bacterium]|nr:hypothetical protein [bacterium]HPN45672.1 hypothetical protein [bacterium]
MIKRLLIYIGLLAAIIYLSGKALEYAAFAVDPNEPKVRQIMEMRDQNYDVMIMGNSIAMQGINPQVLDSLLGSNSYNFAVGGASMVECEMFLRHYLIHNSKPRLIIIGMFVNDEAQSDRLRPTVYLSLEPEIKKAYAQYLKQHKVKRELSLELYNRITLFRYRNTLEHVIKYMVDRGERDFQIHKGFVYVTQVGVIPDSLRQHRAGLNRHALVSYHEYCAAQGIPVLYIELPNSDVYNACTLGREPVLEEINEIIDRPVISFNNYDPRLYPPELWLGFNHFNLQGANKFTAILAAQLGDEIRRLLSQGKIN